MSLSKALTLAAAAIAATEGLFQVGRDLQRRAGKVLDGDSFAPAPTQMLAMGFGLTMIGLPAHSLRGRLRNLNRQLGKLVEEDQWQRRAQRGYPCDRRHPLDRC